ncbi:ribosomal maturation YjgA family protein [Paenibacillus sp. FSL H7-0323]|uniref:ribosomal maturation YjgA family protein n=1 Tax=Paenibacillus sp. FSL H7-0323 TaxID=2921433 RepID=UPI0030F96AB8
MRINDLKERLFYSCICLVVIVLGLSTRVFTDQLPLFVSRHFGDALWGSMVYFMFRVLLVNQKLRLAFVWSLVFNFGIEFSQLYQAEWINSIRSTVLGGLILGKGFLWIDLVRYLVGIALCYGLDQYFHQKVHRNNK